MPYKLSKMNKGFKVMSPSGSHSKKPMTLRDAKAQMRLLQGVEHGNWRPTGKKMMMK